MGSWSIPSTGPHSGLAVAAATSAGAPAAGVARPKAKAAAHDSGWTRYRRMVTSEIVGDPQSPTRLQNSKAIPASSRKLRDA